MDRHTIVGGGAAGWVTGEAGDGIVGGGEGGENSEASTEDTSLESNAAAMTASEMSWTVLSPRALIQALADGGWVQTLTLTSCKDTPAIASAPLKRKTSSTRAVSGSALAALDTRRLEPDSSGGIRFRLIVTIPLMNPVGLLVTWLADRSTSSRFCTCTRLDPGRSGGGAGGGTNGGAMGGGGVDGGETGGGGAPGGTDGGGDNGGGGDRGGGFLYFFRPPPKQTKSGLMCVCVCVCERERERERKCGHWLFFLSITRQSSFTS